MVMRLPKIVVAGHVCVDLIPQFAGAPAVVPGTLTPVGSLGLELGGCVANTGRALTRLGIPVAASARVGDDILGDAVTTLAEREGFASIDIRPVPGVGTSYSIVVETPGRDRMFWHHAGANGAFDGRDLDLADAGILHVGYPSLLPAMLERDGAALRELFARARQGGVVTSLDLAVATPPPDDPALWNRFLAAILPLTDIVSPSIDDLRSIAASVDPHWATASPQELAADLITRGAAVAMVTAGARGMSLATASDTRLSDAGRLLRDLAGWADVRWQLPPAPLGRIVSTNGAGDAASAGLLAGIARGLAPDAALQLAAESAAFVISDRFAESAQGVAS
jgi:sugar/nucleoside kinase (ribokinase family)